MSAKTQELIQDIVSLHSANKFENILENLYDVILSENEAKKTILRSILWPVPTKWDLEVLSGFIHSREISNIFSIGCGTGLLEWLLLQATVSTTSEIPNSESEVKNTENEDQNNDRVGKNNENEDNEEFKEVQNKGEKKADSCETDCLKHYSSPPIALTAVEIDSQWWNSKYAPPTFLPLQYANENFSTTMPFGSRKDLAIFSYFNNMNAFKDYLKIFQGTYLVIIGPTKKQFCAPNPLDLKNNPELPTQDWNIILFQRFGLEAVDHIAIYSKAEDFYF